MSIDVDVLVLGSGIAGLSFALKASAHGKVALVTKKSDTESNTNYAQGGIASVTAQDDSFDLHIHDTNVAGGWLCHKDAVEILVKEGPKRIRELIDLGVRFSKEKDPNGKVHLALGREGGHSRRRILYSADLTGREIERALVSNIKQKENIRIFEHHIAIDLISDEKTCYGAYVLDPDTGEVMTIHAKVTMLATGGVGHVYLYTTNPLIATGDGVAMSYRAGARIANMEFIQFHPTTLYHPGARSFLISEAVRGEGGILRLSDGSTFMENYHEQGCLAPRDVVARAIDAELKKNGDECVYLDITHLSPEKIKARFPNIYEKCKSVGIDITKDWIPIVPAAHYSCGGVLTDVDGRTSLDRLYACGEAACTGVHGANRLASNSLLEAVVFAHRAAEDAGKVLSEYKSWASDQECPEYAIGNHTEPIDLELVKELTVKLQTVMWKYVGIVRTDERLAKALTHVQSILNTAEDMYKHGQLTPELIELRNLAQVAELIVLSAMERKESRGLNYNLDHPDIDDKLCKKDTVIVKPF
ncbi:MAG TPA: L-aspartate oxidase [Armatimonadota bacterium]|nr:L-aspartate oxidase [Armatimonadota bacterium]HPP74028.1 L-aspartate oxidase [Armatimonadota bacterium]